MAEPLAKIFSKSFECGKLPDEWLTANIRALFKNKGNESVANNYRPVSLTCVACKVMESVISDKIFQHVKTKLSKEQHGFLAGKSTVTQLLETLDDWTKAIDKNCIIDVLYIDIAKAFDSVSHPKLLNKLEKYGIRGKLLKWVEAFLSNRRQQVVVNSSASDEISVTSGVPQGSVLGPLLFLLFINDLPAYMKYATVKLFADDCKLYIIFQKQAPEGEFLQLDINALMKWADLNQLKIAFSKCGIIHLGYKNPKRRYYFDNDLIPTLETIRDLGVTISSNLKFSEHIQFIIKSASRAANNDPSMFCI